jgi:putative transcription antitermination factor YqgF
VTILNNGDDGIAELRKLCLEHLPKALIIGLPRGLDGQETRQTRLVREVAVTYEQDLAIPVITQDEAVTSELAREQLVSRGESLENGAIDREAAAIILQDYLDSLA